MIFWHLDSAWVREVYKLESCQASKVVCRLHSLEPAPRHASRLWSTRLSRLLALSRVLKCASGQLGQVAAEAHGVGGEQGLQRGDAVAEVEPAAA